MTEKQKTSEINAEWLRSDEGIEVRKEVFGILGWAGEWSFKNGLLYGHCRGNTIPWACPNLTLKEIADAEDILMGKRDDDPQPPDLRKNIHDGGIYAGLNRHCCTWTRGHVYLIYSSEQETELISRATALLAVRDWLEKEGK